MMLKLPALLSAVCLLFSVKVFSFTDANENPGTEADQLMDSGLDLRAIQPAFNESLATDNIARYNYDDSLTYKLRLRQNMNTTIVLPEGEKIIAYSLGDNQFFTFNYWLNLSETESKPIIRKNIAIIVPKNPGVDTNLTLFGESGLIYSFYLRTDSFNSEHLPHLVAYIDNPDMKSLMLASLNDELSKKSNDLPTIDKDEETAEIKSDFLRELPPIDPTKINRDYEVVSRKNSLAPSEIFDDGNGFTYFKFGDGNLDKIEQAPALYRVVDGYDVPVNWELVNGYYVAKTVSKGWTLRAGKKHLCIREKG